MRFPLGRCAAMTLSPVDVLRTPDFATRGIAIMRPRLEQRPSGPERMASGTADARAAGLRYSSDEQPGITRRAAGRASATARRGGAVRASAARAHPRARHPARLDATSGSAADARGHLQATGRDARGRKQYLYHADWRAVRDATQVRPHGGLRRDAARACATASTPTSRCAGLPRERVLAAVVRLVDDTLIRVGNEQYRRANGSFGATTMRRAARPAWTAAHQRRVPGKGGKLAARRGRRTARLARIDPATARPAGARALRVPRRRGRAPAACAPTTSTPTCRRSAATDLTVKDFRTWGASALCMRALAKAKTPRPPRGDAKRSIAEAIREVADALGNTPGRVPRVVRPPGAARRLCRGRAPPAATRRLRGLDRWESALLRFLRTRAGIEADVRDCNPMFSARRHRGEHDGVSNDRTQIAVLLFAQVRPQQARRGLPRSGAAGAAEPRRFSPLRRVDVDRTPQLAEHFDVEDLPAIVVLEDGHVVRKVEGRVERRAHPRRAQPLAALTRLQLQTLIWLLGSAARMPSMTPRNPRSESATTNVRRVRRLTAVIAGALAALRLPSSAAWRPRPGTPVRQAATPP